MKIIALQPNLEPASKEQLSKVAPITSMLMWLLFCNIPTMVDVVKPHFHSSCNHSHDSNKKCQNCIVPYFKQESNITCEYPNEESFSFFNPPFLNGPLKIGFSKEEL